MTDTSDTSDTPGRIGASGPGGGTRPDPRDRPRSPVVTAVAGVVGVGAVFLLGGILNLFALFGIGDLDGGGFDPAAFARGTLLVGLRFCLPVILVLAAVLWWARVRHPLAATGLLTLIAVACTVASAVQELSFPFAPEGLWWATVGCLLIGGTTLVALLRGRGLAFAAGLAAVPLLAWPLTMWGWHSYVQARHLETTAADLERYRDGLDGGGPGFVLLDTPEWEPLNATVFTEPDLHSILVYGEPEGERMLVVQGADPMNGAGADDPLWEGCDDPDAECFEYPVPAALGEGTAVLRIPGPDRTDEDDRIRMEVDGVVVTLVHRAHRDPMETRTGPFPDPAAEELVELLERMRPAGPDDLRALAEADTRSLEEIH
ncbi:hypothetical protein ACOQFV_22920 [Nocardiopsis changdeensis]|uniref:ABC transporter permease n=1 Tax=Nocardiopsis changdeensis TaxID=2831969 RepID=A0ABX8BKE4_9ACTN|nr:MULTISPECIES: hypothetical protein [Nocardiopsis]QUX21963.1 hypothetical protein KGD84_26945 [Nocardiopsis changdeensis]QYX37900.1 hypothetical protein K1J57_04340 [Nocardiopsis sp. MT53]